SLGPDVSHPAIVRTAERKLDPWIIRDRAQKKRRIENLNTRADFVHVSEARVDVGHFAGLLRSVLADIVAPADQTPTDDPKILSLAGRHIDGDRHRPVAAVRALQVVPGFFRLDDMGIGVYR